MEFARMNLYKSLFSEKEKAVLQYNKLTASVYLFPSGVHGLRISNSKGELVILPFQGQQIWSARFCGKDLAMKSTIAYPLPTTEFFKTYGGFLLHCGATGMGNPSENDNHPIHGELPNIPYEQAYIGFGEDERGHYMVAGGKTEYNIAFGTHYSAEPEIKLYEDSTVAEVSMKLTNLRSQPMEYMYLCHINFRPIDNSRLIYSAPRDREHIKVHIDIPGGMPFTQQEALKNYMLKIAENPAIHDLIDSNTQIYDPEIVFTIKYLADDDGYAHSMQMMPEGDAFYAAFKPCQLPIGLRWISRTSDEDAIGIVLPATAEHKGYIDAKENGLIRTIGAKESVTMTIKAGYLDNENAAGMESKIKSILEKAE